MTTLPDLLQTLDTDGERELQALLADQAERAEAIILAARTGAAALVRDAVGQARRSGAQEAERLRADAAAQARRVIDDTVNHELGQVLDLARARLDQLALDRVGVEVTQRLLLQALQVLPDATHCRIPTGHAPAAASVAPGLEVDDDLSGLGVVVADDAGRSVDNTVDTRVGHAWPELRAALASSWRQP